MRKIVIAGNWKMNKGLEDIRAFCKAIVSSLMARDMAGVMPILAPSYPFLDLMQGELKGSPVKIAAQDVSSHPAGAFTGEVSAAMLSSLGLEYSIVGHSERRAHHDESNELVREKLLMLMDNGIKPILCIGETLLQRDGGSTKEVILEQLDGCLRNVNIYNAENIMIAYEPVWAIGTGRTATGEQAQEVHRIIRSWLNNTYNQAIADEIVILYGGSVKPENLAGLLAMPDIDGGLIGGASLQADKYLKMIDIALESRK
ncbi:MAG: triose-phosphate isomerase [Candidatus Cloacimonadaceae bacterium]|nr:triose-phosphate isomerase [Candidatus Cloacimonadota bacterium]MCK9178096.1 triose-phosphate isomerase [Candidatus Cloacimonadota bacterium]MDD3102780.1 triose-phosphate isomerase [Candidatus Cloacimonadota bacterium]MDD3533434.1 triose-phosphate isomerase [Candidatus Cloacimonadota bacterium]MDY0127179.1 triose-phosphate isomerase [Candidatus Cloacimonadaceae bacterium]